MRVDNIADYRFTKAEVLKLIPTLKAKAFMNWSEDGLIDFQLGSKNRLFSALGIIKLAAMHEAVKFGMRSVAAAELANKISPRVIELWAELPAYTADNSQRRVLWMPSDGRTPIFHATFEVDVLVLAMFTRIHRHVNATAKH